MSAATLENIAIGLITSIVSPVCVWLWRRARTAKRVRRKAAFFGIKPGSECLLVMPHSPPAHSTMSHDDIHALVELAKLAGDLDAGWSIRPWDQLREGVGDRTEFCIGGTESNLRTRGHLESYLPGVTMKPYSRSGPDSLAFIIGDRQFLRDRGQREFAVVAKFTRTAAHRPVFIICGQTAVTNRAAAHYLTHNYETLNRTLESAEQFCIVLRVPSPMVFGYELAELEADVTLAAFTASNQRSQSRGGAD